MAGAPEADLPEITPEMLEAASAVLAEHYFGDGIYDVRDEIMAEMYRAMYRLRPESGRPNP
jgi:hypothetical protein